MIQGISLFGSERVLVYAEHGSLLAEEKDAGDLVGEARSHEASWVALPVSRVHERFFRLETGLAGAVLQKLVNYEVRLALIGDISRWLEDSKALRDFIYETNRGSMFWQLHDLAALERKLSLSR